MFHVEIIIWEAFNISIHNILVLNLHSAYWIIDAGFVYLLKTFYWVLEFKISVHRNWAVATNFLIPVCKPIPSTFLNFDYFIRMHSLRYLKSTPLGWKNIGIRKSELVAKTHEFIFVIQICILSKKWQVSYQITRILYKLPIPNELSKKILILKYFLNWF